MNLKILTLVFSCCFITTTRGVPISEILDVVKIGKDAVIAIAKAWNLVDEHFDVSDIPLPIINRREHAIFNRINIINTKISEVAAGYSDSGSQVIEILKGMSERFAFELKLDGLRRNLENIDIAYERFQLYANETSKFERSTLEDFANSMVSHSPNSIHNSIEMIFATISPKNQRGLTSTGLLKSLALQLEIQTGPMICSLDQSPQQVLLNLYNVIALSELKSYSMTQFSYMLLKLYNKGNFTEEAKSMKLRHKERSKITLQKMREVISLASQDLWKCDPAKHKKDESYVEITELLQGYIQNEVDLNPEATCRENCAEYTYTKSHGCYQNLYCRQQRRCNGKIIKCQYIDSDAWVCPAAIGTNRRYEYIEYENGKILGRKLGCSAGTTKVDSWWRWLFWHCSYCMCLCDEQGANSDRYFNMRSSEASIASNRVVTGLKFTKKNRIIHMQVQEGLLMPKAKIDPDTVNWVPVENYKITDRGIFNGQDFHTLTWEKRNFDLDDLKGRPEEIVTGVRFKLIGSHLNFEVRLTPFDFDSGKLNVNGSYWQDNANTDASKTPRKKLMLENRDIPIRSPAAALPDSKSDQYLEFTNSDLERDAAQTTIPFIDIQEVASAIPVPLAGSGIYHKGTPNFGGFIAPKIITYDYGELIKNAIDDSY